MKLSIFIVDSFTDQPYAGNPAGVCVMPSPRDSHWMQEIASELNLPETAFVVTGDQGFRIQWFTPMMEIDLSGHGTLAAAHLLWELKRIKPDATVQFITRSGVLTAKRKKESWIEMDFPAEPAHEAVLPKDVAKALGIRQNQIAWTGRNRIALLLELKSEDAVRSLNPDPRALGKIETPRGLIVTAKSENAKYDFISRYFAPKSGVFEDPVTGSTHCALGPYWGAKLDKNELIGYQASRRGGWVQVALAANRVLLRGQAVTVIRGEIDA